VLLAFANVFAVQAGESQVEGGGEPFARPFLQAETTEGTSEVAPCLYYLDTVSNCLEIYD
jgi:hypothetical protein